MILKNNKPEIIFSLPNITDITTDSTTAPPTDTFTQTKPGTSLEDKTEIECLIAPTAH